MCQKAMDENVITIDTDTDEPLVDTRLREFFSEHIFQVSRKVVNSFMQHNSNGNGNTQETQPLLIKCGISNRSKENCETDTINLDMDMFQPIYQPFKASVSEQGPNANEVIIQKRKSRSFKLQVAYQGYAFCGWQIQPNNDVPSVQQALIDCLDPLLNSDPNKPIDIRVCGRTDAGVSAVGQYCRVRTLRSEEEVGPAAIQKAINQLHVNLLNKRTRTDSYGSTSIVHEHDGDGIPLIWCTNVERVTDKFHPTFDAKCRAYLYLIDAEPLLTAAKEFNKDVQIEDIASLMDFMLQEIQGEELDFFALSFGKVKTENTLCTLSRARAFIVQTRDGQRAVGIELVGNRFLRRMVRILVATTIREALIMLEQDLIDTAMTRARLSAIVNTNDRTKSAKAAPSNGLLFVGARFH